MRNDAIERSEQIIDAIYGLIEDIDLERAELGMPDLYRVKRERK